MSTKTTTPEEQLLKTTREKLSKYGTPQLLSKLRSGAFLKMSKDVAISILEKRGEDVSEFKSTTEAVITTPGKKKEVANIEVSKEKVEKIKAEKVKVEKAPKAKKEKVPSKSFVAIDESNPEVSKILNNPIESTKTEKIKGLLKLGYSCSQVSKSSLNARYPFVFTVRSKMIEAGELTK